MTMMDAAPLSQVRDSVAVAIARRVLAGQSIPSDMLEEFADLDADAGLSWHAGSSFGL